MVTQVRSITHMHHRNGAQALKREKKPPWLPRVSEREGGTGEPAGSRYVAEARMATRPADQGQPISRRHGWVFAAPAPCHVHAAAGDCPSACPSIRCHEYPGDTAITHADAVQAERRHASSSRSMQQGSGSGRRRWRHTGARAALQRLCGPAACCQHQAQTLPQDMDGADAQQSRCGDSSVRCLHKWPLVPPDRRAACAPLHLALIVYHCCCLSVSPSSVAG